MMRAFLCGINKYFDAPLNGCVNDVIGARQILQDQYKLTGDNIRVLTDKRATTSNIASRLRWLVSETFVHEKLMFWYSGHGAYIPNRDPANDYEVTGNDQIICPVDYDWENNFISDDLFYQIICNKNPNCKLVVIIDACHSGTFYRNVSDAYHLAKPRFIDPPIDIKMRDNLYSLFDLYRPVIKNNKPDIPNFIMISGCKDTQTSADAYIEGVYHGALSYYLQRAWIKYKDVNSIYQKTCEDLRINGFEQEPVLSVGPKTDLSKLI